MDKNQIIKEEYAKGTPIKKIAQRVQLHRSNVIQRANQLGLVHPNRNGTISNRSTLPKDDVMAKMTNKEVSALVVQEAKTEAEVERRKIAERKYTVLKREYKDLTRRYNDVIAYDERDMRPIGIKPMKGGPVNEITPCILFSDWHVEEEVKPNTIGGKNKFNLQIAEKRAAHVTRNAVKRMRELDDEGTINTVALFLLGDFITGHLHYENIENALLGRHDAMAFAEELLIGAIEHLLEETPYNYVVYCKVGNHSRITQKVMASTEWQNSLEPSCYRHMNKHFKDNERIKFVMEESYYSVTNILGWKVRYHHGHAVRYGGGVGGLHIPLKKKIKNWNENDAADVDFMGHYHSFMEHATFKYVVNGSLIGYSAYAERLGVPMEAPMQSMVVIHKKKGVVRLVPLHAE